MYGGEFARRVQTMNADAARQRRRGSAADVGSGLKRYYCIGRQWRRSCSSPAGQIPCLSIVIWPCAFGIGYSDSDAAVCDDPIAKKSERHCESAPPRVRRFVRSSPCRKKKVVGFIGRLGCTNDRLHGGVNNNFVSACQKLLFIIIYSVSQTINYFIILRFPW